MCLDPKAVRSWRAHKGWATRRRAKLDSEVEASLDRVGYGFTRETRDAKAVDRPRLLDEWFDREFGRSDGG